MCELYLFRTTEDWGIVLKVKPQCLCVINTELLCRLGFKRFSCLPKPSIFHIRKSGFGKGSAVPLEDIYDCYFPFCVIPCSHSTLKEHIYYIKINLLIYPHVFLNMWLISRVEFAIASYPASNNAWLNGTSKKNAVHQKVQMLHNIPDVPSMPVSQIKSSMWIPWDNGHYCSMGLTPPRCRRLVLTGLFRLCLADGGFCGRLLGCRPRRMPVCQGSIWQCFYWGCFIYATWSWN